MHNEFGDSGVLRRRRTIAIGCNDILRNQRPHGHLRTLAAEMEDETSQRCFTDKLNGDVLRQR